MFLETKNIFQLTEYGAAMSHHLLHHHNIDGTNGKVEGICKTFPHGVKFIETGDSFLNVIQSHSNEEIDFNPDYIDLQQDKDIQNMVHINGGVVLITADLNLYAY